MRDGPSKYLVSLLKDYSEAGDTDVHGAARDLLTDLKHYCDRHNIDFDESVQRAKVVAAEEDAAEEAKPTKFVVTLEVNANLNGTHPGVVETELRSGIGRLFGEGVVTGAGGCEIDTWEVKVEHD